ncbi:MAG: type 2 lanthipeptide synthetase LanM family protein [Pirellulaceae bacterium]
MSTDATSVPEFVRAFHRQEREPFDRQMGESPEWHASLRAMMDHVLQSNYWPRLHIQSDNDVVQFLQLVAPFVCNAHQEVTRRVQSIVENDTDEPIDVATIADVLLCDMPSKLVSMISRSLVLELNVARLEDRLRGVTAAERFQDFIDQMARPQQAIAFFDEYPVLARTVAVLVKQAIETSVELAERLCRDWHDIRATFFAGTNPGKLVAVRTGAGDSHAGGKSVAILEFANGQRLVYKPRSLSIDRHFQDLLKWVNQHEIADPFRTLTTADRGEYGWVEFIEARECESTDQVVQFYRRQGGYLALFYVLCATDFHYENVIAAGPHPVPVDLETLMHGKLSDLCNDAAERNSGDAAVDAAVDAVVTAFGDSVLRSGMLPQRLWANDDSAGVDMSGLGGDGQQFAPSASAMLDFSVPDQMCVKRERQQILSGQHRAMLGGQTVDGRDYIEPLCEGFASVYRLLMNSRTALQHADSVLSLFAHDRVRLILRPTRVYSLLLQESFHPDVLRDARDRDDLFDRLRVTVPQQPYLERVIALEHADLWKGDVPVFHAPADSCDLYASDGTCIEGFLRQSGLQLVRNRLQDLSEDDLQRQLWIIQAAMSTLGERAGDATCRALSTASSSASDRRSRALRAAGKVMQRIEQLAIGNDEDERINWLGIGPAGKGRWAISPMGPGLYDGVGGVALFLAFYGAMTGDARATRCARGAVATLRSQIRIGRRQFSSIGGFDGWGGAVYLLNQLGILWDESQLLDEARKCVDDVSRWLASDRKFDVMGGAAGAIASCLAVYRSDGYARALDVARQCGEHLLQHRPHETPSALAGFSHGAAGIAWSLLQLYEATNDQRFESCAWEAIRFERTTFEPLVGNWRDLRMAQESAEFDISREGNADAAQAFACAWCHGAAGIGLGRLASWHRRDDVMHEELKQAILTTVRHGCCDNHSLCHGALGNLELLIEASRQLGPEYRPGQYEDMCDQVISDIEEGQWRCGVPMGAETPGLLTGLAGIGYGLLRIWNADRVPSVLLMELGM